MDTLRSTQIKTTAIATAIGLPLAALALLPISYENAPAHIAFNSIAGFIALLAAFLTLGRATQTRQLGDLVLTGGLAMLGATNLSRAFTLGSEAAGMGPPEPGPIVGAAAFAAAAWVTSRFEHLGRASRLLGLLFAAAFGAALLWAELIARFTAIEPATQITIAIFYGIAYVGFTRRGAREGDQFLRWIASGVVLAALARVNYAIPPYPGGDTLMGGDALRMGFYLLLMVAALHEIVDYWRQRAKLTASEERSRIARELHDGLAQELFFIAAKTGILARKEAFPGAVELRDAANRALTESRRAIASLSSETRESLDVALTREAEGIASRFHLQLDVEIQQGLVAPHESRAALLRIVREAITNAARHGRASRVKVRLSKEDGLRLSVADDGSGFDPSTSRSDGYGLDNMRERTRALGGELRVDSVRGLGTVVEAVVP